MSMADAVVVSVVNVMVIVGVNNHKMSTNMQLISRRDNVLIPEILSLE